jgi:hypothetical protein
MSKKNAGLLVIVALVLVVLMVSVVFVTSGYADMLPWSNSLQFVGHCVGSSGGTCGVA